MKRINRYILSIGVVLSVMLLYTGCALISNALLPEEKVLLSYYNAPVPVIAEYLSHITGLPVDFDQEVEDITITLVTPKPVTLTEAETLITAAFEVQNCTVTREKKAISIKKSR